MMTLRKLGGSMTACRLHVVAWAAVSCLITACSHESARPLGTGRPTISGDAAFVGVSVIPMDTERVLLDQTVVASEGIISRIAASDSIRLAPGMKVINGHDKFLMPGLVDMHVHIMADSDLPLYLANGVTMVRNMSGSEYSLKLRERIENCVVLGPTLITAGPILDGAPKIWPNSEEVTVPEAGRRLVREQKAAGYDFIKVYNNLSPEVFHAIADEAKALGIPFVGHIPLAVKAADAMRAGMASVEHMTGFTAASTNEGYSVGNGFLSPELKEIAVRIMKGEITLDDAFSAEKMQELSEISKESGTWQTPTLVVRDRLSLTDEQQKAYFARKEMRYISSSIRSYWTSEIDYWHGRVSAEQMKAMQIFNDVDRRLVGTLHASGTGILAGTDSPNPFVLPGFALYDELEFLEEAGLSRFEAMAAATRNPARFLKAEGEFGVVTEGARADLILLDASPLADLANLSGRQGVMLRGQWLLEAELRAALENIAATDAGRSAPVPWKVGQCYRTAPPTPR